MDKILQNTFIHISGVGESTEQKIWRSNVLDWESFLSSSNRIDISFSKKKRIDNFLKESLDAIKDNNHKFLVDYFPNKEHWRVYPDMKCCYVDIETTGLSKYRNSITTIGLYDGNKSRVFVQGKDLHEFAHEFSKYNTIVTFNGRGFDIPFIREKLPEVDTNKFHIDLRFVMRSLGYVGGLKRIERDMGVIRDDDLQEVDGYEAVRLWKKYQRGDKEALDLLIKYNIADIENLKIMMDFAFERMKKRCFLSVIR